MDENLETCAECHELCEDDNLELIEVNYFTEVKMCADCAYSFRANFCATHDFI